jgi:hypothetical protein
LARQSYFKKERLVFAESGGLFDVPTPHPNRPFQQELNVGNPASVIRKATEKRRKKYEQRLGPGAYLPKAEREAVNAAVEKHVAEKKAASAAAKQARAEKKKAAAEKK